MDLVQLVVLGLFLALIVFILVRYAKKKPDEVRVASGTLEWEVVPEPEPEEEDWEPEEEEEDSEIITVEVPEDWVPVFQFQDLSEAKSVARKIVYSSYLGVRAPSARVLTRRYGHLVIIPKEKDEEDLEVS